SVSFTATVSVTAPGSGAPAGTITFLDGTATLAMEPLSGLAAIFTTSALPAGNHVITAVYSGTGDLAGSTSNVLSLSVDRAGSTATLTSSANPAVAGQNV